MRLLGSGPARRRAFTAGLLLGVTAAVGIPLAMHDDPGSSVTMRQAAEQTSEAPSPTDVPVPPAAQFVVAPMSEPVAEPQAEEPTTTTVEATTTTVEPVATTVPESTTTTAAPPPSTWYDPYGWGQEDVANVCSRNREILAQYNRIASPNWCRLG